MNKTLLPIRVIFVVLCAAAGWLAGLVVRGQVDEASARQMAHEMAYGLAKRAYRLDVPA